MLRRYASALGATLLAITSASAQGGIIPTLGKEFWSGFLTNYDGAVDLHLYISGHYNTTGVASMPLAGWSQPFTVTANQITVVDVPATAMCTGSEVVGNLGILVQTQDTVALFALNHNAATTDAAVIYPKGSMGTQYRVQAYVGLSGLTYNSELLIVATKDGTQVQITPSANTVGGQLAGVPFTVNLDSAQTYQVQAANSTDDMTGTTIVGTAQSGSCRPFAVFSGSVCPDVPTGCFACDHVYDECLPSNVWGTEYFTVPWQTTTGYAYRILANQNGTQVTVNGGPPVNLNAGQYVEYDNVPNAACIQGNVPFSVAQFMQSNSCAGGNSDPALVILNAVEQKINDVTFLAPAYPAFTQQYVNVIVETANVNSVILDGVQVPPGSFQIFPQCAQYSYTAQAITQASHRLSCPGGLIAYVYGLGPNYETYAYSVGSFSPLPPIQVDTVLCGVDSTGQLTLAPPEPYNNPWWAVQSAPNDTLHYGLSYTFTPPGSDVYIVSGGQFQSGCEEHYYFSVEVAQPPALNVTANGVAAPAVIQVCAYTDVQLNVVPSPGGTYHYNWWPDAEISNGTIPNPMAHPSHSGWYYVSVATLNNCAVALDSVYIDVIGGDVLIDHATVSNNAICLGDSTQLQLDVQQIIYQDTVGNAPGAMWGNVQNGSVNNNCGAVSGNAIWFDGPNPRQITTVGMDVSLGGSIQFAIHIGSGAAPCEDVDPGEDIVMEWSTNGGGTWTQFFTLWEYQYANWTTVNVPIPPAAQAANTEFRWRQLNSSGPGQDNWSLDNVAIATHNGTGLAFDWEPSSSITSNTLDSTYAHPPATGWYHVTTTDLITTCVYTDSVHVTVGAPFTLTMTDDTSICDVAGIQLHATPSAGTGHTWNWTPATFLNASFVEDPVATPTSTIEYHVTVTSAEGCTRMDSVHIIVGQLLSLSVSTTDNQLCQGQSSMLNAQVGGGGNNLSYTWTPNDGIQNPHAASTFVSPNNTHYFVCTVEDTLSGCLLRDSVLVNVSTLYNVFAGNDTTICSVNGFHLNVVHNIANPIISWTPANHLQGANTATPLVIFDSTATYIVQVSDNLGCSDKDTVVVTVAFDQLQIFADSSLCAGDSAYIDAGYPNASHTWSTGELTEGIWVNSANNYTVTMTDANGCQSQHTTTITVDPLPIVNIGPDSSLCVGQQWTLYGGTPNGQHVWSTGEAMQNITVNTNGDYWVRVTNQNHCVNSDTALITFDPLPVIDLHDTTVCVSSVITLDAGNPGSSYQWSTGASTQMIQVNATNGTYSVVVTTPTICIDSAQASLTFIPFPVVDLGPDRTLCQLDTIVLDAGNAGDQYAWSTGANSETITLVDNANVWVDVYNGYCTTRDSLNAVFNPLPAYPLDSMMVTCLNYPPYELLLDAQNPGCTYAWSNTATSQTIAAKDYGLYTVTITTPHNCSITDSTIIVEYCGSELFVPNCFTPDGDGHNDTFEPTGHNLAHRDLHIFDRWGEEVYAGVDGAAKWDGKANGTPVQDGVYVWMFKYRFYDNASNVIGAEQQAVGHITVLR